MPVISAIIKPNAIIFLAFESELVQKYTVPSTAAINTAIGSKNLIMRS